MNEIPIISRTTPAKARSANYREAGATYVSSSGTSGMSINFSAEFAKEMANWFVRDAENNAIRPADTDGEATGFYSNSFLSALGVNPDAGSTVTGATALSELSDVNLGTLANGQVLTYDSSAGKWVNKTIDAGLDEEALAEYLTANNYAKKSDIPSLTGYATQSWVTGQLGSYVTTSALTTTLASYVTTSALNTELKKKVDVDFFSRLFGLMKEDGTEITVNDVTTAAASIKAKFGLWTQEYLSALGLNGDAGGTTGATALSELSDVSLSGLAANQILAWNGTAWTNVAMPESGASSWEEITGKPTYFPTNLANIGDLHSSWDSLLAAAKPTTLAGYGITDGVNAVSLGTGEVVTSASISGHTLTLTRGYASKIGTATVGSATKPIYLNAGTPTACTYTLSATVNAGTSGKLAYYSGANAISSYTSTVGGTAKPVYINAGVPTALSTTVGSATRPVYLNAGTITAGTYTFGNASGNAAINNGTVNTNLNADMLDGQHGEYYRYCAGRSNYITITVGGDADTYYPVVISRVSSYYPATLLNISRTYSETAPDSWNTSTHKGGLTLCLLWNNSLYWDGNGGGNAGSCVSILKLYQSYCTMLGGIGRSTSGLVVWLRGGTATYHIHSHYGVGATATVYTTSFTDSADRTFAPTTSVKDYSAYKVLSGVVSSYATALQTARTLWGQSFNGTANVSGNMTGVGSITMSGSIQFTGSTVRLQDSNGYNVLTRDTNALYLQNNAGNPLYIGYRGTSALYFYAGSTEAYTAGTRIGTWTTTGLGIGTTSPSYKLHVVGVAYASTGICSDGYVSALGSNTSSDIRLKDILGDVRLRLKDLARAPLFRFAWKGTPSLIDVGSSAQYWQRVLPDAVKERDGYLEMAYGNIALAGVISLARETETLEQRVTRLEKENARLKARLRQEKIYV